MSKPGQPEYIREFQRLVEAHGLAIRAKEPTAIGETQHDLELFVRYMSQGRIQEYFARQEQGS